MGPRWISGRDGDAAAGEEVGEAGEAEAYALEVEATAFRGRIAEPKRRMDPDVIDMVLAVV